MTALTIATKRMWNISTIDVTGAYLHAILDHDVYLKISKNISEIMAANIPCQEYINDDGTIIVKLEKWLYGLKESERRWYILLTKILNEARLTRSSYVPCLFYSPTCIACIYVDDI